jgi:hypothetical protein
MDSQDFDDIKQRNARVEADKAWETSWTRRSLITAGTYIIVSLYLLVLGVENYWLHALVPTGGFLLSTLSLPIVKNMWLKSLYKKEQNS